MDGQCSEEFSELLASSWTIAKLTKRFKQGDNDCSPIGNVTPIPASQAIMAGVQSGVMAILQATESHTQKHGHSGQGRSIGVSCTAVASTRPLKAAVKYRA